MRYSAVRYKLLSIRLILSSALTDIQSVFYSTVGQTNKPQKRRRARNLSTLQLIFLSLPSPLYQVGILKYSCGMIPKDAYRLDLYRFTYRQRSKEAPTLTKPHDRQRKQMHSNALDNSFALYHRKLLQYII